MKNRLKKSAQKNNVREPCELFNFMWPRCCCSFCVVILLLVVVFFLAASEIYVYNLHAKIKIVFL